MNVRNESMVNHADLVLALWKGEKSSTGNCVKYANDQGVEVVNLCDHWQRHSGFWSRKREPPIIKPACAMRENGRQDQVCSSLTQREHHVENP